MKLKIKIDDNVYEVDVEIAEPERRQSAYVPQPGGYQAPVGGAAPAPASGGAGQEVVDDESKVCRSPISGVVIKVLVEAGQSVELNDTLMILEAMKMETVITAPIAGKVSKLSVATGGGVKSGQVLIHFE